MNGPSRGEAIRFAANARSPIVVTESGIVKDGIRLFSKAESSMVFSDDGAIMVTELRRFRLNAPRAMDVIVPGSTRDVKRYSL